MSDQTITSLIEKLEGASEGNRELDGLIYALEHGLELNGGTFILEIHGYETFQFKHPTMMHPNGPAALYEKGHKVAEVTTSLDAALALAQRIVGEESALSMLQDTVDGWNAAAGLSIRTLPLLLCAALLRAQSEARV